MEQKKLEELTNEELLQEAKKMKANPIINAVFIGVMIGVIVWSVVKNNVGLFTLIPLYLAYKGINYSTKDKALKELLKERNLKL